MEDALNVESNTNGVVAVHRQARRRSSNLVTDPARVEENISDILDTDRSDAGIQLLPSSKRINSHDYDIFSMFADESTTAVDVDTNAPSSINIDISALVSDEIDLYIAAKISNPNTSCNYDFNVLHWWNKNKENFPMLAQLSKFILAIPASSAPSERLFSSAGNTVTDKRNRISPEVLNGVLFLKSNYDLLDALLKKK